MCYGKQFIVMLYATFNVKFSVHTVLSFSLVMNFVLTFPQSRFLKVVHGSIRKLMIYMYLQNSERKFQIANLFFTYNKKKAVNVVYVHWEISM